MIYNVQLTDEFLDDFENICNYIAKNLKSINASNRLREKVIYNILLLQTSPEMFEKTEKFDRTRRTYRRIIVNNYVILYTVDKRNAQVYISHMYYHRRNYINDLV